MISNAQMRKAALELPEAEASSHHGIPDFRVRKKIFATLHEKERRAVLKLPLADQAMLVEADPETFLLVGWAHQGWTGVNLKRVAAKDFRALLADAWRNVAPKRLVSEHEM